MNEIDAVERVLAGDPWVTCPQCEGEGVIMEENPAPPHVAIPHVRLGPRFVPCVPCNGSGFVVALDYLEACNVLGKEPPEPQGTLKVPKNGGVLHLPPMVVDFYQSQRKKSFTVSAWAGGVIQQGDLVAFDSNGHVTKAQGAPVGICINPPTPDGKVQVLFSGRDPNER